MGFSVPFAHDQVTDQALPPWWAEGGDKRSRRPGHVELTGT